MDYLNILSSIGDWLGTATQKVISFLATYGVNVTVTGSKILNILIFLIVLFLVIKLIEKPIKWIIIILLILFVGSTVISFL